MMVMDNVMPECKIGFIGCGNMGSALLSAVQKFVSNEFLYVSDPAHMPDNSKTVLSIPPEDYEPIHYTSTEELIAECDFVFLAVKPQVLPSLAVECSDYFAKKRRDAVLITMLAGTEIKTVREAFRLPDNYPVIRIMPNLAVSVGEGTILYTCSDVPEIAKEIFLRFMKKAGKLIEMKENMIDAGSAISGCGPAYVCQMIDAMADGGVQCGLSRSVALELAEQTLLGTARLLSETKRHPDEVKDAVCSPGGTTIEGVLTLERGAFRGNVSDAVISAYKKTLELKNK